MLDASTPNIPTAPKRVQLRRSAGWRMPPNTVKADRGTRWGNPFHTHADGVRMTNEVAVALLRDLVAKTGGYVATVRGKSVLTTIGDIERGLRGKDVACWCSLDKPCHVDLLIELANKHSLE